jgi:cobyrinic acid a,c-diamide synthase
MSAGLSSGLILSGIHSSGGKTAVTCMLLAALAERGVPVQPFKAGPDFIDPGYHVRFAGIPSRNLDAWMMGNDGIAREAATHGAGKISIVEGVMGLFDGSDVRSDEGSTMELARVLDWPVVLIIPSAKSGRSLAAALRGFIAEAGEGRIAGVILNEVSGSSHADYLREAIAPLKLPVLGAVPFCEELAWPERHLGLQASQEREVPTRCEVAQLAAQHLDLPRLLGMLSCAPARSDEVLTDEKHLRIGIAKDEAFHFYYESNLDHLRCRSAELVEFSPIHDAALPNGIDGLMFGGGFPEVFADTLSQNQSMRSAIRSAIDDGLPCYAECGGLMLLAEELITLDGKRYPMAGAIPGAVEMTARLNHFGYCVCSGLASADGAEFRGHEFHYSRWLAESERANLWTTRRKRLGSARREGFARDHLHASYVHLHFPASEAVLAPLLNASQQTNLAIL